MNQNKKHVPATSFVYSPDSSGWLRCLNQSICGSEIPPDPWRSRNQVIGWLRPTVDQWDSKDSDWLQKLHHNTEGSGKAPAAEWALNDTWSCWAWPPDRCLCISSIPTLVSCDIASWIHIVIAHWKETYPGNVTRQWGNVTVCSIVKFRSR